MMYLIDEQFKVIGKGTSLKASGENFILHHSLPKATLIEVAKSNGIKFVKSADEKKLFQTIETTLNQIEDIPNMTEENTKLKVDQKYVEIVQQGFANGEDADTIQVNLVKAGLKFKQAASTFKKVSEHLGLVVSPKDRIAKATELLGDFTPADWEGVQKAAAHIVENVADTSESQAISVLRKICKDAEVEFPKKPKGAKAASGPRGFKAKAYAWILGNKEATKEDLEKFLSENEQRPVYVPHYWEIMVLCRQFAG